MYKEFEINDSTIGPFITALKIVYELSNDQSVKESSLPTLSIILERNPELFKDCDKEKLITIYHGFLGAIKFMDDLNNEGK